MSVHAMRVAYVVKNLSPQGLIANADKIAKLDSVARKALHLEENEPRIVVNVALLAQPVAPRRITAREIPAPELLTSGLRDGRR